MAFIALEGGEGAGKTTQFRSLMERRDTVFPAREVIFTREPGGTEYAERIRSLIIGEAGAHASAHTQLSLFFAARFDHVDNLIKPALERGAVVVTDRFAASTYAYQVASRAPELKPLFRAFMDELKDCMPALTIFIDVPPEIGRARVLERTGEVSHLDLVTLEQYERRRDGYFEYMRDVAPDSTVVIDGNRDPESVHQDIVRAIQQVV